MHQFTLKIEPLDSNISVNSRQVNCFKIKIFHVCNHQKVHIFPHIHIKMRIHIHIKIRIDLLSTDIIELFLQASLLLTLLMLIVVNVCMTVFMQVWLTLEKHLLCSMGRGAPGVGALLLTLSLLRTLLPYTIIV